MITDERVRQAREFLEVARRHEVAGLPPSVMARELAEARRQVGVLLEVVREHGQHGVIPRGWESTVRQLLRDGISYSRGYRRGGRKGNEQAGIYWALVEVLGIDISDDAIRRAR